MDFSKDHPAIDITNARDGHDERIKIFHDIGLFRLNVVNLAIKEFELLNGMDCLDR